MGLLDYLNQGLDTLKSQPKMYDPHANARALMGGQPMQQQAQPVLNNLIGEGTDTFANEKGSYPTGMLGEQVDTTIGPNMGQINSTAPQGMLSPQVDTTIGPNMSMPRPSQFTPTDTTISPEMFRTPTQPNFPRGYNDEIIESTASMSPFDNPDMMKAIAMQESSNRHTDANGKLITSPAGAVGKYQIMPSTAAQPGFGLEPLNLATATEADHEEFSRNYLNKLNERFGNQPDLTLAAYNYGVGNVEKLLKKHGVRWKEHLPQETSNYLKNFNML